MNYFIVVLLTLFTSSPYAFNSSHLDQLSATKKCNGCDLSGIHFPTTNLDDEVSIDVSRSILVGAYILSPIPTYTRYVNSNFNHAEMMYSDLRFAYIKKSDFSYANLTASILQYADFSNFTGANLTCSWMYESRVKGSNFTGANLSRAFLWGSDISDEQIASAKSVSCAVSPGGHRYPSDDGTPCPPWRYMCKPWVITR